jgi:hypothetical protein
MTHLQHPHHSSGSEGYGIPGRSNVVFKPSGVAPPPAPHPVIRHVVRPLHPDAPTIQHTVTRPVHDPHGRPVIQTSVIHTLCPRRERQAQTAELQDILASPEGQQAIGSIKSGQAHCVLIHTQIPHLPVVSIRALNNSGIIVIGPYLTSKQTSAVFARH